MTVDRSDDFSALSRRLPHSIFSLGIAVQVLKFRTKAQIRVTPGVTRSRRPLYTGHQMVST
jgi:hypothetical protein